MTDVRAGGVPAPSSPRRTRPRDRKSQILTVAAGAFSERGYHAVGVDDIAEVLGISGPALYRHFPTKYALLQYTVAQLADTLLAATDVVHNDDREKNPQKRLDRLMIAIIETTLANRRTGGLYRWESRYLAAKDRMALRHSMTELNKSIRIPLMQLRPELTEADASTITAAAISAVASITAHRSVLSAKQIELLLRDTTRGILATELPESDGIAARPSPASLVTKREMLLHEATLLFDRDGYHSVGIEDIGAAAGMTASSVYRYFPSKADLLAAAFHRAGDRLTGTVDEALARSRTPDEALELLVRYYVELTFDQHALMSVYFAEMKNLPPEQQSALRRVQRSNIERWATLLRHARPELSVNQSRFLVHAAVGLVFDMGRLTHFDLSPPPAGRVRALMRATLTDC